MNKTFTKLLACLMAVAIAVTTIRTTLAYFSDREVASGKATVYLTSEVRIKETIEDDNKHVVIENTGKTDVIVRVRVFANGDYINITDKDGKWQQDGDWYYYKEVLPVGESTSELFVEVVKENTPGYQFNIIVVVENERVQYDGGKIVPESSDWSYVPE